MLLVYITNCSLTWKEILSDLEEHGLEISEDFCGEHIFFNKKELRLPPAGDADNDYLEADTLQLIGCDKTFVTYHTSPNTRFDAGRKFSVRQKVNPS